MQFTCGECREVTGFITFHCRGCDQHQPVQVPVCGNCGVRPRLGNREKSGRRRECSR